MSIEQILVLCHPVWMGGEVALGSATVDCETCGEQVWVSPASQKKLANGALPICITHGIEPGDTLMPPDPETLAELRDHVARRS